MMISVIMQSYLGDYPDSRKNPEEKFIRAVNSFLKQTNKNTEFRLSLQSNQKEYQVKMQELEELKKWKNGVNKALWILFAGLAALLFEMLQNHK